jgi:hypothetical protein
MNCAALFASSLNSTPRWFASTPIGKPCSSAHPVTERRAVARLELVEVAVVDDAGEHVARVERHPQVGDGMPSSCSAVERGGAPAPRGRAALAVVEAATICRPSRIASTRRRRSSRPGR